ncbi:MAG: primosomal protein N' [Myxococcota bacterium]
MPPHDLVNRVAEVAVTARVHGSFHYAIPDDWPTLSPGERLSVPFGRRHVTAIVLDTDSKAPDGIDLKVAHRRLDPDETTPLVPPDLLRLARFAAQYYVAPIGEVLKAALPPSFTGGSQRKLVATEAGRDILRSYDTHGLVGIDLTPADLEWLRRCSLPRGSKASAVPDRIQRRLVERRLLGREDEMLLRSAESSQPTTAELCSDAKSAWPLIRRSRPKRDLYEELSQGPRRIDELVSRFGPRSRAHLRTMERDGVLRLIHQETVLPADPPRHPLNPAQSKAVRAILQNRGAFLLQGITGSGKTEVYLHTVEGCLNAEKGAIVMVPEIGLTPMLEARFRARFGEQVVVLHSELSSGERARRWMDLRRGRKRVALGPRSTVWAPVNHLGLIVVDEEHDDSYKQSSDVRYHARDLALTRAHHAGASIVLGSATPSMESHKLALDGRLERLRLDHRIGGTSLPEVSLVDLSQTPKDQMFSSELRRQLAETLERRDQAILFLNRRGFNTLIVCGGCQKPFGCPHCDTNLTFHRKEQKLRCHHCGFFRPLSTPCPGCGAQTPESFGAGTERVEAELKALFPSIRTARLDRDSVGTPKQLQALLTAFGSGEADVLLGTKMVTKGHDFPNVSLVGVILADASLAFPDFRAHESTFQLLTQTAGRAGRRDRVGKVVIQTLQPEHPVLQLSTHHDVDGFLDLELGQRARGKMPPYYRLSMVRCEGRDPLRTEHLIERISAKVRATGLDVLGPTEAPIGKLKDKFRFRFLVRSESAGPMLKALHQIVADKTPGIDVVIDVDPRDFL